MKKLSTNPSGEKFGCLKGHAIRLVYGEPPFFIVADSEDAAAAMKQIGVPRNQVWTADEVVSILRSQAQPVGDKSKGGQMGARSKWLDWKPSVGVCAE